ncbi:HAD domain-containing protein [Pseudoduganella danionis]|uniref:Uncharacterized protein n=1 Tax=Pseudoduganella danionis TaxID=1890295 RepID=A0ABW9SRM5_9BURK|nr:HAD domain-containing protein [Pseudoduganella danionis]MTW34266.1 hypothetical protein [Pseudoduganella danionis]
MNYVIEETPICVLDFDGCLHHDEVYYRPGSGVYMREPGHHLFEWAHVLVDLLEPYPSVRIALSTSWVRSRGFQFAKTALPCPLRERVIGATYHTREVQKRDFDFMSRGEQVLNYVERRNLKRWFAIDDDVAGWPTWCLHRLVQTQGHSGLSDPSAQNAVRRILEVL